ncbi:MAG: integration host factor subunit beta [Neisseriaceae bacterium]
MTKSELVSQVVEASAHQSTEKNYSKTVLEQGVQVIVESLTHSLALGRRIEIRGFGSFNLNDRPSRMGRNPKTGEKVHVPAKQVPHFKSGKALRELVNASAKS